MGILADAAAIIFGSLLGGVTKFKLSHASMKIFGIGVALMSIVGFAENAFVVRDGELCSRGIYVVVFSLFIGYIIGDALKPERWLSGISHGKSTASSGIIDATVFFGVGGLQISGPMLLALTGDSSQLYLKALIDLPFAVMYGAIYGKRTSLAALPVALVQVAIALLAALVGDFIGEEMISVVCSIGFIILFFSGLNMLTEGENKVNNTKMICSIPIAIIAELVLSAIG